MKSRIYVYLILFITSAFLISCGDDEGAKPQPAANFFTGKTTIKIGEEIQFTNTSENATAFKWSFGDGTTSKDVSPKKIYTADGAFVVSLVSTGPGGSTISTMNITVLPDPEVYFIEYGAAFIRNFSTGNTEDVSDFLDIAGKAGVGLAFDATNQKVYFTDFESFGEGKIWSVNIDGTDLKEIVTGLYDPYGLAVDATGGKIYWAEDLDEDYNGHIGRANLDGSNKEHIVTAADAEFRSVALDLEQNKIYYYDIYNEEINRANLDGTNQEPVLSNIYGYALQIDTENDKLYFDEQNDGELKRANLDGSNVETIDDDGSRIYGITIDSENDLLYWSARDASEIYQANLDGTHQVTLTSGLSSPRGIFVKK